MCTLHGEDQFYSEKRNVFVHIHAGRNYVPKIENVQFRNKIASWPDMHENIALFRIKLQFFCRV